MSPSRPTTGEIGQRAEDDAQRYLTRQGLVLVKRNYRVRGGEIDLIMRDGNELVFVEVRHRRNRRFGSAAETVGTIKQQRLIRAARVYLQRQGDVPCRFDVVAMDGDTGVEWIRDAFQTGC